MTNDNKATVRRALTGFVETGDVDALGTFLHDRFTHRRPGGVVSTKAEWLSAVRAAQAPLSTMEVKVEHLLADGDNVVVHSLRRLPDADREIAVIEIWRFEDGLIAEGFEIIEPLSQVAANLRWWEPAR